MNFFAHTRKSEQSKDSVLPSLASLNDVVDVLHIGPLRTSTSEPYRYFLLRDNGHLSTGDGKLGLSMGGAEVIVNAEVYSYRICERARRNTPSLYTTVQAPDRAQFLAWRDAFEIVLRGTRVADQYTVEPERPLAVGWHAMLLSGVRVRPQSHVVIKVVPRSLPDPRCSFALTYVSRKIRDKAVVHPYIVEVCDVYHSAHETQVVMPYVGPPLSSLLSVPMDEKRARDMFNQLLTAAICLHTAKITHGAICPNNVLVQAVNPKLHLRLSGFSLALVPDPRVKGSRAPHRTINELTHGLAPEGLQYIAPELIDDAMAMSPSSDFWSLGVLLYRALTGELPFLLEHAGSEYEGADQTSMIDFLQKYKKVDALQDQIVFPPPSEGVKHLSNDAKSLLLLLLSPKPGRRSDVNAILQHPWVIGPRQ